MNTVTNAKGVAGFVGDNFHGTLERDGGVTAIAGKAEGADAVFDASHAEDEIPFCAGIEVGHGDAHDDVGVSRDTALEEVENVDAVPLKLPAVHAGFDGAIFCDSESGGHFDFHGMEVGLHVFVKSLDLGGGVRKFPEWLEVDDIAATGSGHIGAGVEKLPVGLTRFLVAGKPITAPGFGKGREVFVGCEGPLEFGGKPAERSNGTFSGIEIRNNDRKDQGGDRER